MKDLFKKQIESTANKHRIYSSFVPFPTTDFPTGKFRAFVLDCTADEIADGIVTIYMDLLLLEKRTQKIYLFCDTVVNHNLNPRSSDFFKFLDNADVAWFEYEDLIGLVFDAEIVRDHHGDVVSPIVCNREFLAAPLTLED